jgi:hypothetical protein
MPGHHHHRYQPSRRPQRGATALEFALILPVLLILFYGALTYTLIFAARMGLQHAAEEGARTALSHRIGADWLSRWAEPVIETRICAQDSDCSTETTSCGRTLATACRMQVTVIYPYAERPILPRIAGFGLVTPAQLRGQASVVMDGRLL